MTELIRILYDYAFERQMQYYLDNELKFHESDAISDLQRGELQTLLNAEGQQHLESYLSEIKLMHGMELEAMFRAGLSLGQELTRL